MKYKIPKMQLGNVVNYQGTKYKDGSTYFQGNTGIHTGKQAVVLPEVSTTPLQSIQNIMNDFKQSPTFKVYEKDKPLSGTDPVGQFIVEGAILGKPTQYLLDKGLTAAVGSTSGELINKALLGAKSLYYNKAPWTFKPNQNYYYRAIPKKAIGAGLDAVKSVGSNYRDMENLNKFAEIYTYDKPKANIFSSKSVDKVYKDLLNQHNTFARGVSTSYKTFQNPDIVDALKAAKVYDPKIPLSELSKDIARYMATNIPRRTGYGRAGLDELDNGMYASNSYNTAKGYTYGDGYIATIRRPVDYSSKNRKDWLRSGDFVASPLDDNSFGAFKTERDLLNEKYRKESNNEFIKLLERYTDLLDYILKRKNYDIDGGDLSRKIGLKKYKQSELSNNALYKKLETLPSDIKFGIDESPLIKEVFSRGPNKRIVKTNENPYQHFIIRGNAGSQPVELIDLLPFTGGADDFTRLHIGNYSEGLSKKSFNFPITYK